MKTAIAIFVKTPGLSPIKTRLAHGIGDKHALDFYKLSLSSIEQILSTVEADKFWAVAEQDGLKNTLWKNFPALHTGEGNLGDRQYHIYSQLLKKHQNVILMAADSPQLNAHDLNLTMKALEDNSYVLGPAKDGGYYIFAGKNPVAKDIWSLVPWSTENTLKTLLLKLPEEAHLLRKLSDVDTLCDLNTILEEFPEDLTDAQFNLKKWIENVLSSI